MWTSVSVGNGLPGCIGGTQADVCFLLASTHVLRASIPRNGLILASLNQFPRVLRWGPGVCGAEIPSAAVIVLVNYQEASNKRFFFPYSLTGFCYAN